jgi:hypothetical protein
MTADWQVFPHSQWNYALAVSEKEIERHSIQELLQQGSPFSLAAAPVKLRVKARKLPSWLAVDGQSGGQQRAGRDDYVSSLCRGEITNYRVSSTQVMNAVCVHE